MMYENKVKMKKTVSTIAVIALIGSMVAGCSLNKDNNQIETTVSTVATSVPTELSEEVPVPESETEKMALDIYNSNPMGFPVFINPINLNDENELQQNTGLTKENAEKVQEAAYCESMMGAHAYSLVLVKVKDASDAQTIADAMKEGINPSKWVCVTADDVAVGVEGQYVLLAMLSSDFSDLATSDSIIEGFREYMKDVDETLQNNETSETESVVAEDDENEATK